MSRSRLPNDIVVTNDVARLRASNGDTFYFDAVEATRVRQHHWYVGAKGRLTTHVGKARGTLYLSRFLTGALSDERVYHRDGNHHDLRSANLEVIMVKKVVDARDRAK